jgi:hypothetical protein
MKTYDVVVKTDKGELSATLQGMPGVPTGLLMQAVMSHQQLLPHLQRIDANAADIMLVVTPSRLELPPGLTIVFNDGVNINGPLTPSPIPNVPPQFHGVQLTANLAALVVYKVAIDEELEDDDEWSEDTGA